ESDPYHPEAWAQPRAVIGRRASGDSIAGGAEPESTQDTILQHIKGRSNLDVTGLAVVERSL
ncbi:MAG: hypothetical protein ACYTG0_35400, partial [Planctomycetota bacterium]